MSNDGTADMQRQRMRLGKLVKYSQGIERKLKTQKKHNEHLKKKIDENLEKAEARLEAKRENLKKYEEMKESLNASLSKSKTFPCSEFDRDRMCELQKELYELEGLINRTNTQEKWLEDEILKMKQAASEREKDIENCENDLKEAEDATADLEKSLA